MIWKVRPMPASQSSCGLRPDMSRPSRRISPVPGRRNPFIKLNSVVLPAPFGPIIPRISFRRSLKLTSWTAFKPPKERDRFRTSSMTSPASWDLSWRDAARCGGDGSKRKVRRVRCCRHTRRRPLAQEIAKFPEKTLRGDKNNGYDGEAENHALNAGKARARFGVAAFRQAGSGSRIRSPGPRPFRRRRTWRPSAPVRTPACRIPIAGSPPAARWRKIRRSPRQSLRSG